MCFFKYIPSECSHGIGSLVGTPPGGAAAQAAAGHWGEAAAAPQGPWAQGVSAELHDGCKNAT